MKYLFVIIIFCLPKVFHGATPLNQRVLQPAIISGGSLMTRPFAVLPPAPLFSIKLNPPTTAIPGETHRLSFRDKLLMKVLRYKIGKYGARDNVDPKKLRLGKISLIMSAAAFLLVLIPVVGLLSLPLAIAGIITGIISLRGNDNVYGIIGLCLGGAFTILLFLAVVLVLIFSF